MVGSGGGSIVVEVVRGGGKGEAEVVEDVQPCVWREGGERSFWSDVLAPSAPLILYIHLLMCPACTADRRPSRVWERGKKSHKEGIAAKPSSVRVRR